jgi:hypothetical protein
MRGQRIRLHLNRVFKLKKLHYNTHKCLITPYVMNSIPDPY